MPSQQPHFKFLSLLLIVGFIFFNPIILSAQKPGLIKRYFNNLINDTADATKPRFLIYPTLAYAPETKWELGIASLMVYNAKRDTTNRLSEIYGFTFYTLENQYGIWLDNAVYADKNKWAVLGRMRFQKFPLLYHGIGPDTPEEFIARVDATQFQLRQRFLKNIHKGFFAGPEVDVQTINSVDFVSESGIPIVKPLGGDGSTNIGLGFGVVHDERHNPLNVRKGIFSELAFLNYNKTWGSDFNFTSIISDNRFYKSVNKRDVLAMQVLGQFNTGNIPFNMLALMGGEGMMRGYYMGRFRDNNQLAAQVEYRMLPLPLKFTNRLGAAVFAGTGSVFQNFNSLSTDHLQWSAGGGLRFLIFPKKDIYTRFDLAFTREGTGIYFFIGEAF